MATHSSILSWRIPSTEDPGRLHPWGHKGLDTTERLTQKMPNIVNKHSISQKTFLCVSGEGTVSLIQH